MIKLSERERATVYFGLLGRTWSGAGDPLCELWDGLDLTAVKARITPGPDGQFDLDALDDTLRGYELSKPAVVLLLHVLGRGPQPLALALVSHRALRRLG